MMMSGKLVSEYELQAVEIFKYLRNTSSRDIPQGFEEAFICDSLRITWTELQKQPQDWMVKMLIIKNQRAKLEEFETAKNKKESKRGRK